MSGNMSRFIPQAKSALTGVRSPLQYLAAQVHGLKFVLEQIPHGKAVRADARPVPGGAGSGGVLPLPGGVAGGLVVVSKMDGNIAAWAIVVPVRARRARMAR